MKTWQLQDAKAKLSELIKQVIHSGPQGISIRGMLEVIVVSKTHYQKLFSKGPSFVELMRKSPLVGTNLNLIRDKTKPRDINL